MNPECWPGRAKSREAAGALDVCVAGALAARGLAGADMADPLREAVRCAWIDRDKDTPAASASGYAEGVQKPGMILLLATTLAAACDDAPIVWEEPTRLPAAAADYDRLALRRDGSLLTSTDSAVTLPASASRCPGSVRAARDTSGEWYAVWWDARPDSTAEIVVARSADGVAWGPGVRVDTVDAGRTGCRRPAPSIDAFGGHVHVVYAMAAREGPGIFASHSMDRGEMFHAPVAVVYGERIGESAIAARGNHVAIAFEDPNGALDRIGIAYSRTMAHLFQHRETVSPTSGSARRPRVALADGHVAVGWTGVTRGESSRFVRRGVIR